jgi:hypothetical protein
LYNLKFQKRFASRDCLVSSWGLSQCEARRHRIRSLKSTYAGRFLFYTRIHIVFKILIKLVCRFKFGAPKLAYYCQLSEKLSL